jgi:biopolymer transport protein ExbB
MNFKNLTVAVAIVAMTSLSAVAPVYALQAPAAEAPAAPAADAAAPAPAEAAPAPAAAPAAAEAPSDAPVPNQYSLGHLWEEGDWISKAILLSLAIMSAGTWYIFFTRWIDQQRILSQANVVEKKFWTSATLNEGVDKLPKESVFRGIAEAGLKASTSGNSLVGLNDWIAMTLTRQLEDANARLQGGIAFLGSVGSVSPFVGLLGTVMGILNALIAIGVSGQASIDRVAGPVGEALIMTALGLGVAVPAVLLYNYLIRRNKQISEKLRAFAGDLQAYLISKSK